MENAHIKWGAQILGKYSACITLIRRIINAHVCKCGWGFMVHNYVHAQIEVPTHRLAFSSVLFSSDVLPRFVAQIKVLEQKEKWGARAPPPPPPPLNLRPFTLIIFHLYDIHTIQCTHYTWVCRSTVAPCCSNLSTTSTCAVCDAIISEVTPS